MFSDCARERAISNYNKAIELSPGMAVAYNNRGSAKLTRGDYQGASADYTKAIELDPKQPLAYLNRGLLLMLQGKEAEANKDFEDCLRISGDLKSSLESRIKEIKRSLAMK